MLDVELSEEENEVISMAAGFLFSDKKEFATAETSNEIMPKNSMSNWRRNR